VTARIKEVWERVRSSVLFVPGVLVLLGIFFAVLLVEADRHIGVEPIRGVPWLFGAGASGARDVLSTIAGAMAQLAGITFSVTIVALALRSQQFGPRLLRNFTRDKANQVVLGTFVGTFVYALLVLRAVRGLEDDTFVPLLGVTFGIVLALLSLAAFIFFIDKVVDSIQATSIIAQAAEETHAAIETLFPEQVGEEEDEPEAEDYPPFVSAAEVLAPATGYIQDVDAEKLLELTREAGIILRMEATIGGFVVKGTPLAMAAERGAEAGATASVPDRAAPLDHQGSGVRFPPDRGCGGQGALPLDERPDDRRHLPGVPRRAAHRSLHPLSPQPAAARRGGAPARDRAG
jgi:uncharacterized membrane protein